MLPSLTGPATHLSDSGDSVLDYRGQSLDLLEMVAAGRTHQCCARWRRARFYVAVAMCRPLRVHCSCQEIRRRDAVSQCVMHLDNQGDLAVGHAVDEIRFPQRSAAVQGWLSNFADQIVQLPSAARAGDREVPQMV